jgi:tetratricopeptide (TPR) repeat protein
MESTGNLPAIHRIGARSGAILRRILPPLCAALAFGAPAQARWTQVRSPHFIVIGTGREAGVKDVATNLENMRDVLHEVLPNLAVDSPEPLTVVALGNRWEVERLLPWRDKEQRNFEFGSVLITGAGRDYLVSPADLQNPGRPQNLSNHALFAGVTRAYLRRSFRALPLWLSEGLTYYFGDTSFYRNGVSVGGGKNVGYISRTVWLDMEPFWAATEASKDYTEKGRYIRFNAESWLLVHYLLNNPDAVRKQLLSHFLEVWFKSGDGDAAAREAFGTGRDLKDTLWVYRTLMKRQELWLKARDLDCRKDLVVRPMTDVEGLAAEANLLLEDGHPQEAAQQLAKISNAPQESCERHLALGRLALAKNDPGAAQRSFLKAAELDPADARPGYALGQNALHHPELADASQSVAWLETSVRLDPNFAPARFALSQAYLATPNQKSMAPEACTRACELDPVNLDYLVGLGRIYLALGKQPEAQAVAKRAVSSAFMPADRDAARLLQTEASR